MSYEQQLKDAHIKQISLVQQFDGYVKLYESAASLPASAMMEQYREQLHTLLDLRLDHCNTIFDLTRKLIQG